MLVVGISTMALIIVLSVFNGLEGLLRSLYGSFDPQIVIQPSEGKTFEFNDSLKQEILNVGDIAFITEVIEDNVLIKYQNAQRVVRLKGVSNEFLEHNRIENSIVYGDPKLKDGDIQYAIVGRGVQYDLSINPNNDFFTIQVYYPRNIDPGVVNPTSLYRVRHVLPSSVFAIEKYYDENYVFVSLEFASNLLNYGSKRSALEIDLRPETDPKNVKAALSQLLGSSFKVKLGEELHEDLYKILRIEKLFVFIIFSLIIGIASINIYFSLTMLAIDKKRDIAILAAQGASNSLIKRIFLAEGAIVALTGALLGLILGLGISFIQQKFGIVSMGMHTTITDAYPVKIEVLDVLVTVLCIMAITFLASIQPANFAAKKLSIQDL